MLPGVLAGAITAFSAALGEFGAVITFVSNIPGETRTPPLALYTALQTPGGDAAAARLACISFVLGLSGVAVLRVVRAARAADVWAVNAYRRRHQMPWRSFTLDAQSTSPHRASSPYSADPGCGKTTLVNIIAGLLDADSGRVALDDEVLLDTERRIYVPPGAAWATCLKMPRFFPHLSVAANLRYGRGAHGRSPTSVSMRWQGCSISASSWNGALIGSRAANGTRGDRPGIAVTAKPVAARRTAGIARCGAARGGAAGIWRHCAINGPFHGVCQS